MSASRNSSALKKPVLILFVSIAFILLALFTVVYVYFHIDRDVAEDVYFQETRWGMTVDEVKGTMSLMTQSLIQNTDPVTMKVDIDSYEGISEANAKGFITYRFNKNGLLESAGVSFLFSDSTSDAFENQVISLFNERYGACVTEERKVPDESTNYVWTTQKSRITMMAVDPLTDGCDSTVIVFESQS